MKNKYWGHNTAEKLVKTTPMTGTAQHTDVMVTYKYRQHCKIKQKSSTIVENSMFREKL